MTVTGENNNLQLRSPNPQILSSLGSVLGNTLNDVGETVGNITTTAVGGVLGVLNVTLATTADFLTPALQSLITDDPITVLDDLLAAVLHPHPLDPGYHGWQYWGCFNSTAYTASHTPKTTDPTLGMSPKLCIALCVADGLEVAVVINAQCYCSNDTPAFNAGSNTCNLACPLNVGLFCGGTSSISVFRRAITAISGPLPASPEPTGWQYSGCFYGDAWLALSPYITYYNSTVGLNAAVCTTICARGNNGISYTYAALYGRRCYCSNSPASLGLQAGVGQCGRACEVKTTEACGGESNYVPYQNNARSLMITLYVRAPAPATTVPQTPATPGPQAWQYYGCYYGAVYLLDAIMNGIQISALLDPMPSMSGDRCISLCLAASTNLTLDFALTLGGTCFCNQKPPTENLLAGNQGLCDVACPGSNGTQRCGGSDTATPLTLGVG
ncbi:hypothetical protein CFE70_009618 [Pyrenophora teres f. teres 0-1]